MPKEYGDSKEEVNYSTLNLKNLCIDSSKPSITLEGQVVAIADEIAQCTHDLEDGIRTVIKFSDEVKLMQQELSNLITKLLVSSQRVAQSDSKAKYIIIKLFKAYFYKPQQLPDYILDRYYNSEESKCKVRNVNRANIEDKISDIKTDEIFIRLICDHISGMTD